MIIILSNLYMHALLFFGHSPFTSKKGTHQTSNIYYSFPSVKKHIINKNNIKVFFHTWDTANVDYLVNFYKPEKYIAENIIETEIVYSYLLSMNKVNNLKIQYENENNMTFDNVILCRWDIIWATDVILSEFDSNKFTISYWGWLDKPKNDAFDNLIVHGNYKGVHVIFFISNSKNMNIFCNLYNELDNYKNNDNVPVIWHLIERYHIEKTKLMDIINFHFIVGIDLVIEWHALSMSHPYWSSIGQKIKNGVITFD